MTDVGQRYTASGDVGEGPGAIPAGAAVVVTAIVAAGTPGVGASAEDTVVADYAYTDHALDPETGSMVEATVTRALALPASIFAGCFALAASGGS
jgi:hypothetical protein